MAACSRQRQCSTTSAGPHDCQERLDEECDPCLSAAKRENGKHVKARKRIACFLMLPALLILLLSVAPVRNDLLEETVQGLLYHAQTDHDTIRRSEQRVLVVGLIPSLKELIRDGTALSNPTVLQSIAQLCEVVHVDLHILHRRDPVSLPNDDDLSEQTVRDILESRGCNLTLLTEDKVLQSANQTLSASSRYKRLATLRSLQRSWILNQQSQEDYHAVMVVDLDLIRLPSMTVLQDNIEYVSESRHGIVLCANGMERWNFLPYNWFPQFHSYLFYDTLAAIDEKGRWYYGVYTQKLFQTLTLAQSTLFQQILFSQDNKRKLWPMQSCFGGLAIYDFKTWSHSQCDYDASQIRLPRNEEEDESTRKPSNTRRHPKRDTVNPTTWQLSPEYTLSGLVDGDACEHVTFHQCLRAASKDEPSPLEIGIPTMVVERGSDNSIAKVISCVIIGVLLILVVILWQWGKSPQLGDDDRFRIGRAWAFVVKLVNWLPRDVDCSTYVCQLASTVTQRMNKELSQGESSELVDMKQSNPERKQLL